MKMGKIRDVRITSLPFSTFSLHRKYLFAGFCLLCDSFKEGLPIVIYVKVKTFIKVKL